MLTLTSRRVDAARFLLESQARGRCGLYVHIPISEEAWNDPALDRDARCVTRALAVTQRLPGTWRVDGWRAQPLDDNFPGAVVHYMEVIVRCVLVDYEAAMAEARRIVESVTTGSQRRYVPRSTGRRRTAASVDLSAPSG